MAKKLKDEDLVLNIIINGNKGKKEMNELERAITDTNREITRLKKVQKDLIDQGKKETDAYKATVVAIHYYGMVNRLMFELTDDVRDAIIKDLNALK